VTQRARLAPVPEFATSINGVNLRNEHAVLLFDADPGEQSEELSRHAEGPPEPEVRSIDIE
jgi:hypothetical protein